MKRKIYEKLINWKNNGMKKPLMIIGARQVGKTYIINEFCKKQYKNAIQINLLNHPEIVELYKQNISLEEYTEKFGYPEEAAQHIRQGCCVSMLKAQEILNFIPRYSAREAVVSATDDLIKRGILKVNK